MPLYSPSTPNPVSYLFVDAGALRGHLATVSRRHFGGQLFKVDLAKMVGSHTRVFYYDALPVRERDEDEGTYKARIQTQSEELNAASSIDRVHVYEGDAHRRKKRGLEQKKSM